MTRLPTCPPGRIPHWWCAQGPTVRAWARPRDAARQLANRVFVAEHFNLEIVDNLISSLICNLHICSVANPYTHQWRVYDSVSRFDKLYTGGSKDAAVDDAAQLAVVLIVADLAIRLPAAAELSYSEAPHGRYLVDELVELARHD